jgi:hypothetical protein
MKRITIIAAFVLLLASGSCGHGRKLLNSTNTPGAFAQPQASQLVVEWPALPVDKAQPWEKLDGAGRVVSSINLQSEFVPGVERFLEAGNVSDLGEASAFTSGSPGEENVSWAIYRIPMGAEQPGTIAADANLRLNANNEPSAYYIGVGDYSVNTWHWYGPYSVSHVRFNVPPAAYTSGLGNLMLAVVAYDGVDFDLVGLGVNARDGADTTAPPVPSAPTLTPIAGGVLAEWIPVVAADLAGYRIYANGNNVFDYIEGGTSIFIPASADVEITLSAVDVSGNESAQSSAANAAPLTGDIPVVELNASSASGMRGDIISLTASGADSYDWDTDGDGTWDITDDTTGSAFAVTTDMGIIRPALRAHAAGDGFWMGAVSLIIAGNSRPVVSATGVPQSGAAPLSVDFTITAEDTDGTIAEYAWDFDGDGIYDSTSPTNPSPLPNTYAANGLFNAKFRVTDNEGGWDVDTVAVNVIGPPVNLPPAVSAAVDVSSGVAPLAVSFTLTGLDSDGTIAEYMWDFDGDGTYDGFLPANPSPLQHTYPAPGLYNAKFRVTDNEGSWDVDTVCINALSVPANLPPVALLTADPPIIYLGETGSGQVTFDALESYDPDGTAPLLFNFDPLGDNNWVSNGNNPTFTFDYSASGSFNARVSVQEESGGLYDVATVQVRIYRFGSTTVDSAGETGYFISLAIVNGNPAISYYDFSNGDLKYVRASDTSGASWASPVTVDSAGMVGSYTSLAVVNGNPAISYYDGTNDDLKYVRATDASGTSWASPVTVDGAGDAGLYTSLEVVNGNPAISYRDITNGDLKYVRANDASGISWASPVAVDSAGIVGSYTSLEVVNGIPAISYYDLTNGDLKYVRASDASGTSWGSPVAVDSAGDVGWYTSLAVVNGNPAISYRDITNGDLKFAYPRLD